MKKQLMVCDCNVIHEDVVNEVKDKLPNLDELEKTANLFKVLADNTRFKIITTLLTHEMCVCDLSYLLNMSQSLVSHQLRKLRKARLVKHRREGKVVYYSLDDEHIERIVQYGLDHIRESGEGFESRD
ncbi:MAG: helix-turn-helix transcriptional regulator [Bacilli bacterium]|nr:helix-turn-helix transcriptional regulator [Bacilli bacterium]